MIYKVLYKDHSQIFQVDGPNFVAKKTMLWSYPPEFVISGRSGLHQATSQWLSRVWFWQEFHVLASSIVGVAFEQRLSESFCFDAICVKMKNRFTDFWYC